MGKPDDLSDPMFDVHDPKDAKVDSLDNHDLPTRAEAARDNPPKPDAPAEVPGETADDREQANIERHTEKPDPAHPETHDVFDGGKKAAPSVAEPTQEAELADAGAEANAKAKPDSAHPETHDAFEKAGIEPRVALPGDEDPALQTQTVAGAKPVEPAGSVDAAQVEHPADPQLPLRPLHEDPTSDVRMVPAPR